MGGNRIARIVALAVVAAGIVGSLATATARTHYPIACVTQYGWHKTTCECSYAKLPQLGLPNDVRRKSLIACGGERADGTKKSK